MKNFWKYFSLTVLLLFGLLCVGVLYMFFVGAPLFNIRYVGYNKDHTSSSYVVGADTGIDTISLTNRNFDVRFLATKAEDNSVSLKVHNGVFGFTTIANSQLEISEKVEGNVLKFEVTEPHGFAAVGSSYIEIRLPKEESINLVLVNEGATTTIKSKTTTITRLSYTTKSGNFDFQTGKMDGIMDLNLGRAKFTIQQAVETANNRVNLKMTSGSFDCSSHEFGTINLISSTSGVIRAKKCDSLQGENEDAGGSITVGEVGNANIEAGDTNVNLTSLGSGTILIGKSGSISVKEVKGTARLVVEDGNLNVGKASCENGVTELFVKSGSGDITVADAFGNVNASSKSGNINVTFNEGANHFSIPPAPTCARRFFGKTETGRIEAHGAENINIEITGKGSAFMYLENVLGSNSVSGGEGEVYVEIKELTKTQLLDSGLAPDGWAHYTLTTQSGSGDVSVNLSQTETQNTGGYTTRAERTTVVNDNGTSANNTLLVTTTSGNLKIRDTITRPF